uniref:COP9 signalosome complex subunit 5 n=2 Tax=Aplanochytrium stocchinoi TaxID=215587 RepID=A0A7S3PF33_9STRA|mmetsp:Transcript_6923/g.8725  ORF Transcript_6923/g.8725 Transcript_6923/m.8725 type:complete len:394 (-) Transcript_6923:154-1335(-)
MQQNSPPSTSAATVSPSSNSSPVTNPNASASLATANDNVSNANALFTFNQDELTALRNAKAWMADPKYFKKVKVSGVAAMKMMNHAVSGVEKGMKSAGGKPVEVMGLMLGRPHTEMHDTLIVADVFPLPVEGAETRVLADDQEVLNYMIDLGESLEKTRAERFMGWYHSHPFDVDVHSHCFMSGTDVATQLQWQRSEDRNGNPWLAIVVDPLRSLAKGRPELGAFRVYPPDYTAPSNETPDGRILTDDKSRVERWGSCWNRYHTLEISFFLSSLSSNVLSIISKNVLWMNSLTSTPILEPENRDRLAERIFSVTEKLRTDIPIGVGGHTVHSRMLGFLGGSVGASGDMNIVNTGRMEGSVLEKCSRNSSELSVEQCQGCAAQLAKYLLFCAEK